MRQSMFGEVKLRFLNVLLEHKHQVEIYLVNFSWKRGDAKKRVEVYHECYEHFFMWMLKFYVDDFKERRVQKKVFSL